MKTNKDTKILFTIIILFTVFLIDSLQTANSSSLFTKSCSKEDKKYFVERVFDGDTILVEVSHLGVSNTLSREKIRLLGIDAFEYEQLPYGPKAKDFLTKLLLKQTVCIEVDKEDKDIYGRTLGYVFINKSFINEELLKNGLAILYDFPPNIKYLSRLKKAQIYGRENMLGAWKEHNYIPETPAQWRHKHPFKKNKIKNVSHN